MNSETVLERRTFEGEILNLKFDFKELESNVNLKSLFNILTLHLDSLYVRIKDSSSLDVNKLLEISRMFSDLLYKKNE